MTNKMIMENLKVYFEEKLKRKLKVEEVAVLSQAIEKAHHC
ncbi:hypothetical protein [Halalkalibacter okhensis]|nr:hypothetical protein [Halalkalibacter okhensis]